MNSDNTVLARVDDVYHLITFSTPESADNFVRFVQKYQLESGAGNGYGAYWIFQHPYTEGAETAVPVSELDESRIMNMARAIASKKSGGESVLKLPAITIGHNQRGAVFDFLFTD